MYIFVINTIHTHTRTHARTHTYTHTHAIKNKEDESFGDEEMHGHMSCVDPPTIDLVI